MSNYASMTDFGASKNPMLSLANPAKVSPDWALPDNQAVNFSAGTITRTALAAGTKLYRVYGGPARMTGAYWSPDKPDETSEGRWRGINVVEPWWNAGTHVADTAMLTGADAKVAQQAEAMVTVVVNTAVTIPAQ